MTAALSTQAQLPGNNALVLLPEAHYVRETDTGLVFRPDDAPETLAWVPQKYELADEARQELDRRLAGIGKRHALGYERVWLDCLLFTDQRDDFEDWKGPS